VQAQYVDTTGVSVSVSGNEVTTTKRAGTANVATSVTVTPYGVFRTDTYEGSGRTNSVSTYTRFRAPPWPFESGGQRVLDATAGRGQRALD